MTNLRDKSLPMHLHEGSYLDVFPKDKLIYLTSHCREDLTDYNPDAIYIVGIVGAMVDASNHEPLSMMKAKELGIKMAKLPLERYLDWGTGDKTLTLDQMMKIMLEWRATNSWDKALKHVPRRKLMNKDVRRWTVNASKFQTNYGGVNNSFDYGSESTRNDLDGLSTAEKFKRKPAMNRLKFRLNANDLKRDPTDEATPALEQRPAKSNESSNQSEETAGLADKAEKSSRTGSKTRGDKSKVPDK